MQLWAEIEAKKSYRMEQFLCPYENSTSTERKNVNNFSDQPTLNHPMYGMNDEQKDAKPMADWVFNDLVERDLTRKYCILQRIPGKTFINYLKLTILEFEQAITDSSSDWLALPLDDWTNISTHSQAVLVLLWEKKVFFWRVQINSYSCNIIRNTASEGFSHRQKPFRWST